MKKQYSIDFYSQKRRGDEFELRLEWPSQYFSSRQYKEYLIQSLFNLAAEGCHNEHLVAYVKRDGEKILTVYCDTVMDGSTVTAYLRAARPREVFWPLRTMVIGE